MTISLYYGDEEYLLSRAARRLRESLINPQMGGLGHKVLHTPRIGEVLEAVGAVYFNLGGKTLIEVHDFEFLHKAASDPADERQLNELMALLGEPDETKHIAFIAAKASKTVKFTKWLTSGKVPVDVQEYKTLNFWQTDEAVQHVLQEARQMDIAIQPAAAALLVEHLGVAMRPLMTEVEKLAVYAGDRPVTPQDVAVLSNHNENTFQMLGDWLHGRNRAGVFHTLDELLLRQHPIQLFALTQSWLGNIYQLRYWQENGVSPFDMAERTKKKPFKIKKDLEEYARVPFRRIETLKRRALDLEWKSKTGELDARLAFEMLMGA